MVGVTTVTMVLALAVGAPTAERGTGQAKGTLAGIGVERPDPPPPDAPPPGFMIRVVTRDVSPDVPRESFGARPRILYRIGEKYGRLEEELDREQGIHGLIVVAEPLVWMVNLANMTGQRIVDPGPSFVFRAPIIPPSKDAPQPPMMELGMEAQFLKANGAKRQTVVVGGRRQEALVAKVKGYTVTLTGPPERPTRVRVELGGKILVELEYLEYRSDLPPRMELFVPPRGVQYRSAE